MGNEVIQAEVKAEVWTGDKNLDGISSLDAGFGISIAVIKQPGQKKLVEERVYISSQLSGGSLSLGKSGHELKA